MSLLRIGPIFATLALLACGPELVRASSLPPELEPSGRPGEGVMTAQEALLATPMPIIDGGVLSVSGGACEVRYEGTSNNVAIAFTTETHPSLVYGRWNGSVWTLEVVDTMGFNTGGVISSAVSMRVESNGTPHIVYVRDGQAFYATKGTAGWARERVDNASLPITFFSSFLTEMAPSVALSSAGPSVLYTGRDSFSYDRAIIAQRTGPNTWTRTVISSMGPNSSIGSYAYSELTIDSSGQHLFVATDNSFSSSERVRLVAWKPAGQVSITAPSSYQSAGLTRINTVLVSSSRWLARGKGGVIDLTIGPSFATSTVTVSALEQIEDELGKIEWNPVLAKPVVLHQHGSTIELSTTDANGFWTYTELGASNGSSAGLTVHPTTGVASVCYQANSRIVFQ